MQEPTSQSAVMIVDLMNLHEETVDYLIWPEAVYPQGHLVCAVCESLIDPAEDGRAQADSC